MSERKAEINTNIITLSGGQMLSEETIDPSYTELVGGRRLRSSVEDLSTIHVQAPVKTDYDVRHAEWNSELRREDIQGF